MQRLQYISSVVWKAPAISYFRVDVDVDVDVDADFNEANNLFSAGVVIRDHRGQVFGRKSKAVAQSRICFAIQDLFCVASCWHYVWG